eukprot:11601649-Heterocapsa_arctica.AAC.1
MDVGHGDDEEPWGSSDEPPQDGNDEPPEHVFARVRDNPAERNLIARRRFRSGSVRLLMCAGSDAEMPRSGDEGAGNAAYWPDE